MYLFPFHFLFPRQYLDCYHYEYLVKQTPSLHLKLLLKFELLCVFIILGRISAYFKLISQYLDQIFHGRRHFQQGSRLKTFVFAYDMHWSMIGKISLHTGKNPSQTRCRQIIVVCLRCRCTIWRRDGEIPVQVLLSFQPGKLKLYKYEHFFFFSRNFPTH